VAYAPPTFVVQCNHPDALTDHYRRYVENRFRQAFGLEVPIRFVYKERKRKIRPQRAGARGRGKAQGAGQGKDHGRSAGRLLGKRQGKGHGHQKPRAGR